MMSGKNNSNKKTLPLVHFTYKRTPIYDRPNYPFDEEMQIGLDIVYGNKTKWKIPIPLAHEIITITLIFDGIWKSDKLFERKGPLEASLMIAFAEAEIIERTKRFLKDDVVKIKKIKRQTAEFNCMINGMPLKDFLETYRDDFPKIRKFLSDLYKPEETFFQRDISPEMEKKLLERDDFKNSKLCYHFKF